VRIVVAAAVVAATVAAAAAAVAVAVIAGRISYRLNRIPLKKTRPCAGFFLFRCFVLAVPGLEFFRYIRQR
jgi:hypothetical protein